MNRAYWLIVTFNSNSNCSYAASECFDLFETDCSKRSASQTLIMDCRVTPSREASLSRESIIHVGKSTFTRLCFWLGRLIADKSSSPTISALLSSNFLSKSLAFLDHHLGFSGSPSRNNSNIPCAIGYDSRPVLVSDFTDNKISELTL